MAAQDMSTITFRYPTKLKSQFEAMLEVLGLNMSSYFSMSANQLIIQRKIPFEAVVPQTLYDELDFISANRNQEDYVPFNEFINEFRSAVSRGSANGE
ncbi:MAG: type II toxin-antitoxin system RelB/DinJ family antitoxin [Oscillospiraceae bacterium]|jgi:addiction module RelB/DinJ family antitoxin|nr:type II toxin-antitoxin system RelB/DinJ family antitoxin [Oscillospiraceae bacterium]